MQPDRGHDEVELDEDGAEGEDAADEHREEQVEVPRLVRVRRGEGRDAVRGAVRGEVRGEVRGAVRARVRARVGPGPYPSPGPSPSPSPSPSVARGSPRVRRSPRLAGDDARDHVGLDRRVLELPAVAEPHADPHEREGDEEPDAQQREHGAEGHGARRGLAPCGG